MQKDIIQQKLRRIILDRTHSAGDYEKTKGLLRYEALRKLSTHEMFDLRTRTFRGENFDDIVDQLIVKQQS